MNGNKMKQRIDIMKAKLRDGNFSSWHHFHANILIGSKKDIGKRKEMEYAKDDSQLENYNKYLWFFQQAQDFHIDMVFLINSGRESTAIGVLGHQLVEYLLKALLVCKKIDPDRLPSDKRHDLEYLWSKAEMNSKAEMAEMQINYEYDYGKELNNKGKIHLNNLSGGKRYTDLDLFDFAHINVTDIRRNTDIIANKIVKEIANVSQGNVMKFLLEL